MLIRRGVVAYMRDMSQDRHGRVILALEALVPRVQQQFVTAGPLRGYLPVELRAEVVQVFTQVLGRAIKLNDERELVGFVEDVVWEARKLGVRPEVWLTWLGDYSALTQSLLDEAAWQVINPMLLVARRHIERLQNN